MIRRLGLCAVLWLAGATFASAAEIRLTGLDGRTAVVTEVELLAMPRVEMKLHPTDVAPYAGVLVRDVLIAKGLAAGESPRGPGMATILVFRAADGYAVALSFADLYPEFRKGRVLLADRFDGQPLKADQGPFHLVVEGDERPARSAYQLTGIEIRNLR